MHKQHSTHVEVIEQQMELELAFSLDRTQVLRLNSKFHQRLRHLTGPQTMVLLAYSPKEIALEDHNIPTTVTFKTPTSSRSFNLPVQREWGNSHQAPIQTKLKKLKFLSFFNYY